MDVVGIQMTEEILSGERFEYFRLIMADEYAAMHKQKTY